MDVYACLKCVLIKCHLLGQEGFIAGLLTLYHFHVILTVCKIFYEIYIQTIQIKHLWQIRASYVREKCQTGQNNNKRFIGFCLKFTCISMLLFIFDILSSTQHQNYTYRQKSIHTLKYFHKWCWGFYSAF